MRSQHHASPNVIHVRDDTAVAEGYSIFILRNEDGTFSIPHANFSRWTFRREEGVWKILEREIKVVGSPSATTLFTDTAR
jgi:hypothetical protein